MFELKVLAPDSVPSALAKAERYRLLNQPWEAESIYLDVLQVDANNDEALVGMLLAITDQFVEGHPESVGRARDVLQRLRDDYERAYYAGIICERRAKAILQRAGPGSGAIAHELLREARSWFEKAAELSPASNDDAILRWNACARLVMRYPHILAPEDRHEPYTD